MCEGDDDAMEYIHMDYYSLIIEIIADATFSWLKCDLCVKESTKMNEERCVFNHYKKYLFNFEELKPAQQRP